MLIHYRLATLSSDPFLCVRMNKVAKWKIGLSCDNIFKIKANTR